jgi:hypothetical protein
MDGVIILLNELGQYIAGISRQLAVFAGDLLTTLTTYMGNAYGQVIGYLQTTWQSITVMLGNMASTIGAQLSNAIASITSGLNRVWNAVENATLGVLSRVGSFVQNAITTLQGYVQKAIDYLYNAAVVAIASLTDLVSRALDTIGRVATAIQNKAVEGVQVLIATAQAAQVQAQAQIGAEWARLTSGAESILGTVGQRLADVGAGFKDAAALVADVLKQYGSDWVDGVKLQAEQLANIGDYLVTWPELDKIMVHLAPLLDVHGGPIDFRGFIKAIVDSPAGKNPILRGFVLVNIIILAIVPFWAQAANMATQPALQELALSAPYQVLDMANAAAAWRRGNMSQAEAMDAIQRQGFTAEDARRILFNGDVVPGVDVVLAMWLRGNLPEAQLDEALQQQGYTGLWREQYKAMANVIPGVGDLITMAVREAFTPDIAERFGQYQDFPKVFADWAAKQGLSEEWAKAYWASHWGLPSAQQGFEMFHRGVITRSDLELLLRALDVMPFWRDKLTQIAYNPLTRVDIRRMHKLGVLDRAAVLKSHKDIGYDDANAELMTQYVEKLNGTTADSHSDELGNRSKNAVLGFYSDGLIDRARAVELLEQLGVTPDGAALFVYTVDLEKQREERKAVVDQTIQLALSGEYSFAQAEDKLRQLGLETVEVEKAVTELERAKARRTKLPTRSEGERFYKLKLIGIEAYRDLLVKLGYPEQWVNAYTALAQMEG